MSGLLLVNLRKTNLDFDKLNELAKKLVTLAIEKDFGISFNSSDYGNEIIVGGVMRNYFHISNSFLYRNCDLLNLPNLILKLCGVDEIDKIDFNYYPSREEFKFAFLNEYSFLNDILETIFYYDVTLVEIVIVDAVTGIIMPYEDFKEFSLRRETFLTDLFDLLNDPLNNNFNYEFPNAKILISRL